MKMRNYLPVESSIQHSAIGTLASSPLFFSLEEEEEEGKEEEEVSTWIAAK